MRALPRSFLVLAASLSLIACEQKQQDAAPLAPYVAEPATDTATVDRRTQDLWQHGINLIAASMNQVRQLREVVEVLLQDPDEEKLAMARTAWHDSHNAYLAAELFTALGSGNPSLFSNFSEYDFAIEAWPIQPGYLDYFDVYTFSGIVNDTAMPLTAEALREQHGLTDAADVSLGFHAMEYLLWGERGERPASDYTASRLTPEQAEADLREVDLPNNRRRVYLSLLANLLLDDLEVYKTAMEDSTGVLRRSYLALHPYTRVQLFEAAAHAVLSYHRDLLQAQLESRIASEGDGESVPLELQHTPFAGNGAESLQHSLATLRRVMLDEEKGLAPWLSELEDTAAESSEIEERLNRLEATLSSLEKQPHWPPRDERAAELVSQLSLLSESFAAHASADSQ